MGNKNQPAYEVVIMEGEKLAPLSFYDGPSSGLLPRVGELVEVHLRNLGGESTCYFPVEEVRYPLKGVPIIIVQNSKRQRPDDVKPTEIRARLRDLERIRGQK